MSAIYNFFNAMPYLKNFNIHSFLVSLVIFAFLSPLLCVMSKKVITYRKKEDKDTLSKNGKTIIHIISCLLFSIYSAAVSSMRFNITEWKSPENSEAMLLILIIAVSVIIMITDARVRIIPNVLLLVLLFMMTLYKIIKCDYMSIPVGFGYLIGMMLLVIGMTKMFGYGNSFGAGDIKFLSVAAYLCIYELIVPLLLGLAVAQIIISFTLLLMKKATLKSMIPFGPAISIGLMTACLFIH